MQREFQINGYRICPIRAEDGWRLCDFLVANETYLTDYFPKTLRDAQTPDLAKAFAAKKEKEFIADQELLWVVKEDTSRTIVGLIYLKELHKLPGEGELAYAIHYRLGGQGLMGKWVGRIISFCFGEMGLDTLQIIVHKTNLASVGVAKKNGFTWAQTLKKEYQMPYGDMVDMELYLLKAT